MKRFVLGGLLLFSYVWLTALSFSGYAASKPEQKVFAINTTPNVQFNTTQGLPNSNELLQDINEDRIANNLKTLEPNKALEDIAQIRAQDMVVNKYYAHANPETGDMYFDLLGEKNLRKGFSCENLDLSQSYRINSYTNDWLASPDHRDCIILHSKITKAGIAITEATFGPSNSKHYLVVTIYQE